MSNKSPRRATLHRALCTLYNNTKYLFGQIRILVSKFRNVSLQIFKMHMKKVKRCILYWIYRNFMRNSPGFNFSILRHSEIWGAAEEAVLNNVHEKGEKSRIL